MSPPDPEHIRIRDEMREEIRQARFVERLFVARLRELEAIEEATEKALYRRVGDFDFEHEPELAASVEYGGKIYEAVALTREKIFALHDEVDRYGREAAFARRTEDMFMDVERAVIALRQIARDLGATLSSAEVDAVYAESTATWRRVIAQHNKHLPSINEGLKQQQINWVFG